MEKGKISVLMGIYNCENTLNEAIESIKNQTYCNWELIMCDDGSIDNTFKIAVEAAKYDDRISVLKNDTNLGLNKTLNKCFEKSNGEFIARMDADDICVPERFEKQLSILESKNNISIVSSRMFLFDEEGVWGETSQKEYPTVEDVVIRSPICHAPVMMYRNCMEVVGGYTESNRTIRVEDVDLWIKLYAAGFRCYNIQETLYGMRNDKSAFSRRKYKYRINSTVIRLRGCFYFRLGVRSYMRSCMPLIVGLVPSFLRQKLRRHQGR